MERGVHSKGTMVQQGLVDPLRQYLVCDVATKRPWLSLSHLSTGMCDCHKSAGLRVCSSHWMEILDKQEAVLRESVSLRGWQQQAVCGSGQAEGMAPGTT